MTDKKIERYARQGWYSAAFKEARRELMARKAKKSLVREGNFIKDGDRLIYSPG